MTQADGSEQNVWRDALESDKPIDQTLTALAVTAACAAATSPAVAPLCTWFVMGGWKKVIEQIEVGLDMIGGSACGLDDKHGVCSDIREEFYRTYEAIVGRAEQVQADMLAAYGRDPPYILWIRRTAEDFINARGRATVVTKRRTIKYKVAGHTTKTKEWHLTLGPNLSFDWTWGKCVDDGFSEVAWGMAALHWWGWLDELLVMLTQEITQQAEVCRLTRSHKVKVPKMGGGADDTSLAFYRPLSPDMNLVQREALGKEDEMRLRTDCRLALRDFLNSEIGRLALGSVLWQLETGLPMLVCSLGIAENKCRASFGFAASTFRGILQRIAKGGATIFDAMLVCMYLGLVETAISLLLDEAGIDPSYADDIMTAALPRSLDYFRVQCC